MNEISMSPGLFKIPLALADEPRWPDRGLRWRDWERHAEWRGNVTYSRTTPDVCWPRAWTRRSAWAVRRSRPSASCGCLDLLPPDTPDLCQSSGFLGTRLPLDMPRDSWDVSAYPVDVVTARQRFGVGGVSEAVSGTTLLSSCRRRRASR
jgi:hypothetical protein